MKFFNTYTITKDGRNYLEKAQEISSLDKAEIVNSNSIDLDEIDSGIITEIKKAIKAIIENQGGSADFIFIVDEILKNFQILKKDGSLLGSENDGRKVIKTILGDTSSGKMFTLDRIGNWIVCAPIPAIKKKFTH